MTPSTPLLSNSNLSSLFSFECNTSNLEGLSWGYSQGQITLHVNYSSDLEDQLARATFAFDHVFIESQPMTLEFTVQSDGFPLIIYEETI